jgi:glutathione S-transferase
MPEEAKTMAKERLATRLKWLDSELAGKQYLMGDTFSVADGYLFTVTNWAKPVGLDISSYANLLAYRERVGARPAVQAAMKAEGLLK